MRYFTFCIHVSTQSSYMISESIDFDEPFQKLFNQGMITGKNGIKMSKSKGNVVSPDDLVRDYGCDSLRMYELFVGPPELDAEWDDRGIDGVNRFLKRVWNLVMDSKDKDVTATKEMIKAASQTGIRYHNTSGKLQPEYRYLRIHGVQQQADRDRKERRRNRQRDIVYNGSTAVSIRTACCRGDCGKQLGHAESVFKAGWPTYDEDAMKDDEIEVPVQINGKTKAVIEVSQQMFPKKKQLQQVKKQLQIN